MLDDLLIVSAAKFEAIPTLNLLEKNQINHQFFELGIGPLNASQHKNEFKELALNKNVVFIGSGGVFGEFTGINLYTFSKALWLPFGERIGLAQSIDNLHPPITCQVSPMVDPLPKANVITDATIALDPTIPKNLNPDALWLENMEAYIAIQAYQWAQSFSPILAVTNKIGPQGRKQWKHNYKEAALKTAKFIENRLTQGA